MGDYVTAFGPATGKTSTQTVQHVWINHETDLIDVTLHVADQQGMAESAAKHQRVAVAAHGLRAPPVDAADLVAPTTHEELIHTTAKHPWLTTDRGFVLAGTLHAGERVVREDDTPATVVAVTVRRGAADYYNLTVSVLHTYTVGAGQYVVHNCESMRDPKSIGFTQDSIISVHPDGHAVEGNIQWLTDNPDKDLPPIQIFQKTSATDGIRNASNLLNGEWYSLDNRRLYAYQQARRALIPIVEISESDAAMSSWKWTTDTWGIDIRVR